MICLCKQQVSALGNQLATLDMRFNVNLLSLLDLPKLSLMLGAMESAKLAASLNLSLLPPALAALNASFSANLSLSTAGAMEMISLGMSLQAVKLALGIDLTAKDAAAQLAPLAVSAAAAWPSLSALLKAELAKLLDLLPLASMVLQAKALGVNLLQANASAELAAALSLSLSARLSLPLPTMSAHLALLLQASALVAQIKLAFGIDLLAPGGMAQLQSTLSLLANLHLPQIKLNLPPLSKLLALISAVQTIKLAFGIDLGKPGAGAQLALMLNAMLSLKLPQIHLAIAPPALNLPALKLALSMNLKGLDLPKLSLMLGNVPNLGLGPLSSLLSLTAAVKLAFAINLAPTITLGCGPECPLAKL